jgi:outer membrane protein OmpA-like peptidoglycan-associated protein
MRDKTILFCFLLVFTSFHFYSQKKNPKADTLRISIVNAGKNVNSEFPEYAPVISADGLIMVFTSRKPVTEREYMMGKMGKENVYITYFDEKKKRWGDPKRLEETVNEPGRHNSAIALSNDGQKMLLYRDDNMGNGDIYESELAGDAWSIPLKLPAPINSKYHESSATYSPNKNIIFFVSNRKGGLGGRDIWYCEIGNNEIWGEAKNAGPVINTPEDEEGIFLHPDGKTLYFSSKGHKGEGGYDIYRSVLENGSWSAPENLSEINTPEDDLYFVLGANGQTGFFASAKPGGMGDKDIYEIYFKRKKKESSPQLTLLKGIVSDEVSGLPVQARIEILDNEKNKVINTINSNEISGKYLASLPSGKNYGIVIRAEGYLFQSENVNIPYSAGYQEIIKDIKLKKVEIGKSIVLNNIFYDFDKATLRPESKSELLRLLTLMKENPKMKVEISSHTDDKGSDDYNMKLSQARAQSVVDFLIENRIEKERLTAKGYGETVPISPNDTDEGRQLNRRTEFKILEI